jgi:hypothetical protein
VRRGIPVASVRPISDHDHQRCYTDQEHSFRDRNLFEDDKLAELLDQAWDVVNGLSTDELRQDANLRKYIADEMNQLRIWVDGALEDLPRRKIRLTA